MFTRSRTNSCPKLLTKLCCLNVVVIFAAFSRCRDIIAICKTEICASPGISKIVYSDRITTAKKTFFHSFLISKNVLHIYYCKNVSCCLHLICILHVNYYFRFQNVLKRSGFGVHTSLSNFKTDLDEKQT